MRETWTDERLDDLNGRVGEISQRLDAGFNRLDAKIDSRFDRLDAKIGATAGKLDAKIESLNGRIVGFGGTLIVAVVIDAVAGRL